jgi:hypothetical protein
MDAGLGVSKLQWQAYKGRRKYPKRQSTSLAPVEMPRSRRPFFDDTTHFLSCSSAPAASKRDSAAENMWAGPNFDVLASQRVREEDRRDNDPTNFATCTRGVSARRLALRSALETSVQKKTSRKDHWQNLQATDVEEGRYVFILFFILLFLFLIAMQGYGASLCSGVHLI